MAKISMLEVVHDIFGRCIKISNDKIELLVTVDFGPRIIHFSVVEMQNMFYQDNEKTALGEFLDCYNGDIIKLYGGHRIWMSPEIMPQCYYPDNQKVDYEILPDGEGIKFTAPIEDVSLLQKSITVRLMKESSVAVINHSIKNCGIWPIEIAPWSITMLDKGGKEIIPQNNRETGYLHNRNFSLWPYSNMNDERVYWGNDFITINQNENMKQPFKVGMNNEQGWAAYFNKGQVFIKFFDSNLEGNYPDNGCSFETYTNNVMCECEVLGEVTKLLPNQEVMLEEEWEIYKQEEVPSNDPKEIRRILSKYMEL